MHIFFTSLTILFIITSCDQGWIFNKTVPLYKPIKQILQASDKTIIMQTQSSIYTALLDSPDTPLRYIVERETQIVPFAKSTHNSSFLYQLPPYITYEETGSLSTYNIKGMKLSTNFVIPRLKDKLYFYNSEISSHLLIYNMESGQLVEGPFLVENGQNCSIRSSLRLDPDEKNLQIVINTTLFIFNLQTMSLQKFVEIQQGIVVCLIQSITSDLVITQNEIRSFRLYRVSPDGKNYTRIYLSSTGWFAESTKIGYIPAQQPDKYYEVRIIHTNYNWYKRVIKFSGAEPYDKIVDEIDVGDTQVKFHRVGEDMRTIYSVLAGKDGQYILKYEIIDNSLHFVQAFPFSFDDFIVYPTFAMITKTERLVYSNNFVFLIWDIKDNSQVCSKQISDSPLYEQQFFQLDIDPQIETLYIITKEKPDTLVSLNIKTCQIKSKTYDGSINQTLFHKGFILLPKLQQNDNLYKIDKKSMEIIEIYSIHVGGIVQLQGYIFGTFQQYPSWKIYRLDDNYQIDKTVVSDCVNTNIILKPGSTHLVAICDNQYTLFNKQLEYLGSTVLTTDDLIYYYVQQTFNYNLRFDTLGGKLHFNIFDQWQKSVQLLEESRIQSNLYFFNKTHFLCLTNKENILYLTFGMLNKLNLQIIKQQSLHINWNKILATEVPLRWSCDKRYILLQYIDRADNFNIFINVYEANSLKIVYSHFISMRQKLIIDFTSNQFIAYLDCDEILYLSKDKGIDLIDIKKRKTVIPEKNHSIHTLAISSNAKYILINGQTTEGQLLGVWSLESGSLIDSYKISKTYGMFYSIQEAIFSLMENKLYRLSKENTSLIHDSIQGCDYLHENSLICLSTASELVEINASHSSIVDNTLFKGQGQIIASKELIIAYKNGQLIIYSSQYPFQSLQTITMQQQSSDIVAISSDSTQIITYDQQKMSLSYWNKGQCPQLAELTNGICKCTQGQKDETCTCESGFFALEGKCTKCIFYCKQCQGSEGGCLSMSAAGILMILGLSMLPILVGVGICCYFRKRRHKKAKSVIMSELLEQQSSINDD